MAKHEYYVENTQWSLLSISQKNENIGSQSVVTFTLHLKRNPTFVVFYVAIPVVMLAILNAFTFALPPASGEKASFSIIVFLSFVVYVIVTYQKMPENSDKISLFALFVLLMTFLSSVAVMITTLELRIVESNPKRKIISKCAKRSSERILKFHHQLLCIRKDVYNLKVRNKESHPEIHIDDSNSNTNVWKRYVSSLDIVFFYLFLILTLGLTMGFLIFLAVK